jgi:hypothetical protein
MDNHFTLVLAVWIGTAYFAHAICSAFVMFADREPHWRYLMGRVSECIIVFLLATIGGLHFLDASPLWATSTA